MLNEEKRLLDNIKNHNRSQEEALIVKQKNSFYLHEDPLTHFRILNQLFYNFLSMASYKFEFCNDGFMFFVEEIGRGHFHLIMLNQSSKRDLQKITGQNIAFCNSCYSVREVKKVKEKMIRLHSRTTFDNSLISSKAHTSHYIVSTDQVCDKKGVEWSELLGPFSELYSGDILDYFQIEPDFTQVKRYFDNELPNNFDQVISQYNKSFGNL